MLCTAQPRNPGIACIITRRPLGVCLSLGMRTPLGVRASSVRMPGCPARGRGASRASVRAVSRAAASAAAGQQAAPGTSTQHARQVALLKTAQLLLQEGPGSPAWTAADPGCPPPRAYGACLQPSPPRSRGPRRGGCRRWPRRACASGSTVCLLRCAVLSPLSRAPGRQRSGLHLPVPASGQGALQRRLCTWRICSVRACTTRTRCDGGDVSCARPQATWSIPWRAGRAGAAQRAEQTQAQLQACTFKPAPAAPKHASRAHVGACRPGIAAKAAAASQRVRNSGLGSTQPGSRRAAAASWLHSWKWRASECGCCPSLSDDVAQSVLKPWVNAGPHSQPSKL